MPDNITLFLESRKGFFYYYNWTAGKESENSIHWCECGRCNYGAGMHREQKPGFHGVWIGPFVKLENTRKFVIEKLNRPANFCGCTRRRA